MLIAQSFKLKHKGDAIAEMQPLFNETEGRIPPFSGLQNEKAAFRWNWD